VRTKEPNRRVIVGDDHKRSPVVIQKSLPRLSPSRVAEISAAGSASLHDGLAGTGADLGKRLGGVGTIDSGVINVLGKLDGLGIVGTIEMARLYASRCLSAR
jgi:hypothetical protein